jgi:hypothetical protein
MIFWYVPECLIWFEQVSMACFDSTYLFGAILESFRKEFFLATRLHIILFPYLLYPFNQGRKDEIRMFNHNHNHNQQTFV